MSTVKYVLKLLLKPLPANRGWIDPGHIAERCQHASPVVHRQRQNDTYVPLNLSLIRLN